ncbi:MAG TPA: CRTAC1 family protein [Pirellulaceae bacterium]|nr:CRTAC1 family protein [Pirellulaceae bacterium]
MRHHGISRLALFAVLLVAPLSGCRDQPAAPTATPSTAAAITPPQPQSPILPGAFVDVTDGSGIDARYRNGEEANHYSILESLGGGIGLIDYDRDGLLDVFVTGGGHFSGPKKRDIQGFASRLYKNLGDWKFRDVTAELGLDQPLFYTHGCAIGDYDRDGWPDLLVTGYGRLVLYRNEGGKRFVDVTEAMGLAAAKPDLHWSTAAAFADLTGDGRLDLFVAHYVDWSFANHRPCRGYGPGEPIDVCPPNDFEPLLPQLFVNDGSTFRAAGPEAGLKPGKALGVLAIDLNADGKLDLYVANDAVANHCYLNQGDGRFVEQGTELGVAYSETGEPDGSMGVDAASLGGEDRFSIFVTNYHRQSHALYLNRGEGVFSHESTSTGIRAIGQSYVGWGAGFMDYDRDGDEDLVVAHGHVIRHPPPPQTLAQRPVLLENVTESQAGRERVEYQNRTIAAGAYFQSPHRGRGVALGDLDNDGRIDLVISHIDEQVTLLKNVTENGNHWLGIELVGADNRDPIGAVLTLEVDGRKLVRAIKGGGSYLSASDRRVVFGLGTSTSVSRLTVRWPLGGTQSWGGESLGIDKYVRLVEGNDATKTTD